MLFLVGLISCLIIVPPVAIALKREIKIKKQKQVEMKTFFLSDELQILKVSKKKAHKNG